MHNQFSRRPNLWEKISILNARDMQIWDTYQFQCLDGDNGGISTPATPIGIGGSGVQLANGNSLVQGSVATSLGGRMQLGASDYLQFSGGTYSYKRIAPMWQMCPGDQASGAANSLQVVTSPAYGVQSLGATSGAAVMPIPSRYLHQGATLGTVILRARLLQPPSSVVVGSYLFFGINAAGTTQPSVGGSLTSSWAASHAYALNSFVKPLATQNGYVFQATSISGTGTSGGSEPVWPTTIGLTVTDNPGANQIVWTCAGYIGTVTPPPTTTQGVYAGGQPQQIPLSLFGASGSAFVIDTTTYTYSIQLLFNQYWVFHSLELDFSGITDTHFA